MCPHCMAAKTHIRKRGFFLRTATRKRYIQRYFCNQCRKSFHIRRKPPSPSGYTHHLDEIILNLFSSSISQRRCAKILGLSRTTIARKVIKLGSYSRGKNAALKVDPKASSVVVFDEMETFEHTKCKPLSLAIAVQEGTRKIISIQVTSMPAKGRLAKIAKKRYGFRPDHRHAGLSQLMQEIKKKTDYVSVFKSDECPRYPKALRNHFADGNHQTFKSRRACVVGQGELKAGGFDPLFSLNHTCAMVRDNLKRLSRRSWCSTKKPERLKDMLDIYTYYHNSQLDKVKRLID